MKKFLILLAVLVLFCAFPVCAEEIPVYINGERLEFDVAPMLVNERTMVPMRFIFEKFGATVAYEHETRSVMAGYTDSNGDSSIIFFTIGSDRAFINNKLVILDAASFETEGRTLVPLRFISEALGHDVFWNEEEFAVYITTKN